MILEKKKKKSTFRKITVGGFVNQPVILLPVLEYSLCLLNLGISPIKSSDWGKISKFGENIALFWIGKQPVFSCKIGKIKSLSTNKNILALISLN